MTKASNAEPASSEIGGGPVSRRAGDGGMRADGQETVPPAEHQSFPPVGATLVATLSESCASTLPQKSSSRSLWLWVTGGFLLLVIAWTVMFTVARSAKIQSVPLTTSGGGTR